MKKHSLLKTLFGIGMVGVTAMGIIEATQTAKEEKDGDFTREFPDKADEIKELLIKIKKEKEENQNG